MLFDTYKVAEILPFVEGLTMSPGHIIIFLTGFPPGGNRSVTIATIAPRSTCETAAVEATTRK